MNQDMKENRKLFGKKVNKANAVKVENSDRIKDGNGKLAPEESEMQRILKECYEDLYNIGTQELVAFHLCGFDGVRRSNYFRGEPIRRTEVEVRKGSLMERLPVKMRSQEK